MIHSLKIVIIMSSPIKYLIVFVASILLLLSCYKQNKLTPSGEINITIDVNPNNVLNQLKASELFSDISYIPLETNNNSLVGNISKLIKYKDRFYITDNDITHSIFCFSETGKFLFKINRVGTGPGEYVNLSDFSIDYDQNKLLVYDNSMKRILHFSLNGDYVESHAINFHLFRFSYIANGYFAFYNDFTKSNKELLNKGVYPNLIITDRDYKIVKTGMNYSEDVNFSAIPMLPQCFNRYDSKTISLISSLNDTIYHISDTALTYHLNINFKNNQRREIIYNMMNDPDLEIDAITNFIQDNNICDIFFFVESKQKVFFVYSISSDTHYVFYDKNTKELKDVVFKSGRDFPIINDIDGSGFTMPIISDGNLFYGIVSPDELFKLQDEVLYSNAPNKQRIRELLKQVLEDDNPIIAIITPNNQPNE